MLPPSVKVGCHTYRLSATQAGIDAASRREQTDLYGHTDHASLSIQLAPDVNPSRQRETALHEILHCITEQAGIVAELGSKDEERIVDRIAPLLLDTLRRNPRLVTYLLG